MKKSILILAILSLLPFSIIFTMNMGMGVNFSIFSSPLKNYNDYITSYDYKKIGFGVGGEINFSLYLTESIIVRSDVSSFITFSRRNDELVEKPDNSYYYINNAYTFLALPFIINGIYLFNPESTFRFYGGLGLGIIPVRVSYTSKMKLSETSTTYIPIESDKDSANSLGGQIVLGGEYFLGDEPAGMALVFETVIRMSSLKFTDDNNEEKPAGFSGGGISIGMKYYIESLSYFSNWDLNSTKFFLKSSIKYTFLSIICCKNFL